MYTVHLPSFRNTTYIPRSMHSKALFLYSTNNILLKHNCSVTETWLSSRNKSSLSLRSERKASSSFALFRSRCPGKCKEIHAGIFPRRIFWPFAR